MILAGEGVVCALPGSFGALECLLGSGLRCVGSVAQLLQALLMRRDRGINRWRVDRRGRLPRCGLAQGILLRVEQFLVGVTPFVTVIELFLLMVSAILSTVKYGPVTLQDGAVALFVASFELTTVQLVLLFI